MEEEEAEEEVEEKGEGDEEKTTEFCESGVLMKKTVRQWKKKSHERQNSQ